MKLNAFREFWKGTAEKTIGDDMKVINLVAQKIKAIERNDWKEVERLEREIAAADRENANKSVVLKKGDIDRKNRETLKSILSGKTSIAKSDKFSIGMEVGYHGRSGEITHVSSGSVTVYFSDADEETEIDADELREQNNMTKTSIDYSAKGISRRYSDVKTGDFVHSDTSRSGKLKVISVSEEVKPNNKGERVSWVKLTYENGVKDERLADYPIEIEKSTSADAQKIQDQIDELSKDFDRYNDAGDQKAADRVYAEIQKLEKKLEGLQVDKAVECNCAKCGAEVDDVDTEGNCEDCNPDAFI